MPATRVTSNSPWHIVLIMDDSGSMSGTSSQDVNEGMRELHAALEMASMGQKPYFKVSVISFGTRASTLCTAVSETDLDLNVVANFSGGSGTTNAAAALDEAQQLLLKNGGNETDFEPFVFFFSDGHPDNRQTAIAAADALKNLSVPAGTPRIVALGFGDVDDSFMKQIATNPELYKKMNESSDIVDLLPNIGTVAQSTPRGGAAAVEKSIMNL